MNPETRDACDRQRFTEEIDLNFSVQASAGAGKTTLLISRVRHLAQQKPAELQNLVLVTYTNRAAHEIRQRLRAQLLSDYPQGIPPLILQGMSRMFIGTIHGFCLQLIQDYALFSGFPSEIEVHSKIRPEWIEQWESELLSSPSSSRRWISDLRRYELAWNASEKNRFHRPIKPAALPSESADLPLDPLALDHVTGRSGVTIAFYQKIWKQFCADIAEHRPAEIPEFTGLGGKSLVEAWPLATAALLQKIHEETFYEIDRTSREIQQKRFREGRLLFSDQIALAYTLLQRPAIRSSLQQRSYRILLDEAQDTDPFQFLILLELTRSPSSPPFDWSPDQTPPRPGLFSMVGDLKQSIYRDRADLDIYQEIHHKLSQPPAGEALLLSQTFRCRPHIVHWVNRQFSTSFQSRPDQVPYHPLDSRHPTQAGQVIQWSPPLTENVLSAYDRLHHEARWLVAKIAATPLSLFRASAWSQIAILAPTGKMLTAIQAACLAQKVPFKIHFDTPNHQRIEYRWMVALLTLQEQPDDSFNLIGILREIFTFSDTRIAAAQRELSSPISLFTEKTIDPDLDLLLVAMRETRNKCLLLSLPRLAREWIERFQIRDRLRAALPHHPEVLDGLEILLLQLSQNNNRPRAEQIQKWVDDLDQKSTSPSPDNPDALQLMTIKKSKGLQWDCVILPFLGAISGEGTSTESHPSIQWFSPPYLHPVLTLNKGNRSPHAREEEAIQNKKFDLERQRLYYVAATRSRQTLILIDDAHHWTKFLASGEPTIPTPNAYEALHPDIGGKYHADALRCSSSFVDSELTADTSLESSSPDAFFPSFDSWPTPVLRPISSRTKSTPSQNKIRAASPALPLSSTVDGRAYGTFFHQFVELFPWKRSAEIQAEFRNHQLAALSNRTHLSRFNTEWNLFTESPLFSRLISPAYLIYSEVPYTSLDLTSVEEGQIDLILQGPSSAEIIDWKTDALALAEFERYSLPGYSLQLNAYRRALKKIILTPLSVSLYHTPSGMLLEIPPSA